MRLRHLICLAVAPNVKLTEKYDAEREKEERAAKRHLHFTMSKCWCNLISFAKCLFNSDDELLTIVERVKYAYELEFIPNWAS